LNERLWTDTGDEFTCNFGSMRLRQPGAGNDGTACLKGNYRRYLGVVSFIPHGLSAGTPEALSGYFRVDKGRTLLRRPENSQETATEHRNLKGIVSPW
jgi:hypothetical protein